MSGGMVPSPCWLTKQLWKWQQLEICWISLFGGASLPQQCFSQEDGCAPHSALEMGKQKQRAAALGENSQVHAMADLSLSLQAVSSSSRPVPLPSQAPAKLLSSSPTSPFTPWLCHPCQTGQEAGGSLETVPAPSKLVNMQHALHSDTSGDLTELIKREGGRTRMKGAVKSIRPGCISQG